MKSLQLLLFISLVGTTTQNISAQTVDAITTGAGYANAVFYDLATGTNTSIYQADWHIAFSVYGQQDGGIFINEGSPYSFTNPADPSYLYQANTSDYSTSITSGDWGSALKNPEISWANGAFNEGRNLTDYTDYGWGSYMPMSNAVIGNKVYVVELPNGAYKKVSIDSLVATVYYFRYADLDGSNEEVHTIDKSNYPGKTLVYFSMVTNTVVDAEPTKWDMLMTRYETLVPDVNGTLYPYTVTGVLTNKEVEVAVASGVDPTTVALEDYENSFSTDSLTLIGHEWKAYTGAWVVSSDLVFFVKDVDANVWKVKFIDYEGASTGVARLEKTDLGPVASIEEASAKRQQLITYPNPVLDQVQIIFETRTPEYQLTVSIQDILGQTIEQHTLDTSLGLNNLTLPLGHLSAGTYLLSLQRPTGIVTTKIQKR